MKDIFPCIAKKPRLQISHFFWQTWGHCNIETHSWKAAFKVPGKCHRGSAPSKKGKIRQQKLQIRKPSQGKPTLTFVSYSHLSSSWIWEPCSQLCLPKDTKQCVLEGLLLPCCNQNKNAFKQFSFCSLFGSIKSSLADLTQQA